MESEDLSERIEWETRRVAAAFGMQEQEFESYERDEDYSYLPTPQINFSGKLGKQRVSCTFHAISGTIVRIVLFDADCFCRIHLKNLELKEGYGQSNYADATLRQQMAFAIYRLGIEDAGVWDGLKVVLTAHEKMELRLSMPREYWPQMWINGGVSLDKEGL